MTEGVRTHPLDGEAILVAGAKASVPLERLSTLVETAQAHLSSQKAAYDRRYERLHATADSQTYLVDPGHWREVGERLDLESREADAIRRAHAEQVRRLGRELDRVAEFETALEIREAAVIG